VSGDTLFRGAKNSVNAVETIDRIAPRSWAPLVAFCGFVVKVVAARALHDIAANRRHIPDLARRAVQDRLRQHGISLAD